MPLIIYNLKMKKLLSEFLKKIKNTFRKLQRSFIKKQA